ncbi:MAG TPA: hypothetical protein VME17_09730 [Bryobacteraceae bacterium]|nr:hypothetical protein [Bryobacteraceae bacterium]
MQYILTGFTHERGFRVFAFEGVAVGVLRVEFTVRADLDLSRRYGIRLQDLPLICRGILERRTDAEEQHALTFTEDAMRVHANNSAAARDEAAHKKPARRPVPANGAAWGSQGTH